MSEYIIYYVLLVDNVIMSRLSENKKNPIQNFVLFFTIFLLKLQFPFVLDKINDLKINQ